MSEIEYSWNFIKRFIKTYNPHNAKDTLSLLQVGRVLDSCMSDSWRNLILVNLECYMTYGYFSHKLASKMRKSKGEIVSTWHSRFADITEKYRFLHADFLSFQDEYRHKMVRQLSFEETQPLL